MRRLNVLDELYPEVDLRAQHLGRMHASRLVCRLGCTACCVDDLTVFEVEAENIRRAHRALLDTQAPGPPGACAFLDEEGACRIYAERPYVCRTQGLPLRWLDENEAGEMVELRDICPLNDAEDAPPIAELPGEACWTIGPIEERLATLQIENDGKMTRVSLRSLFR